MAFCTQCGKELKEGVLFCPSCGKKIANVISSLVAKNVKASETAGEFVAGRCSDSSKVIPKPLAVIKQGVQKLIGSVRTVIKDPKQLMPVIIFTVLWLIVDLLPALGINPFPVSLLSFLSFGQAGMGNSVKRVLGGAFGKGVFAGFAVSLLSSDPLNSVKSTAQKIKSGPKEFFKNLKNKYIAPGKGVAAFYILGLSIAVLLFDAMAPITAWSLCGGAAATAMSARALTGNGFLKKLFTSIYASWGSQKVQERTNAILKGITTGFGFSTVFGLILGKVFVFDTSVIALSASGLLRVIAIILLILTLLITLICLLVEFSKKDNGRRAVA